MKEGEHHCGGCGNATRNDDPEGFCEDCRLADHYEG